MGRFEGGQNSLGPRGARNGGQSLLVRDRGETHASGLAEMCELRPYARVVEAGAHRVRGQEGAVLVLEE